jgi:hypothetical protein
MLWWCVVGGRAAAVGGAGGAPGRFSWLRASWLLRVVRCACSSLQALRRHARCTVVPVLFCGAFTNGSPRRAALHSPAASYTSQAHPIILLVYPTRVCMKKKTKKCLYLPSGFDPLDRAAETKLASSLSEGKIRGFPSFLVTARNCT